MMASYLEDPSLRPALQIYIFIVGAIIGSFLNVCIYRIPRSTSITTPRSSCPHCGTMISWYHNIPIFSYLWLQGRCAHCKARISPAYPLVELITATFFLLLYRQFNFSIPFFIYSLFGCGIIILIFVDYYHRLLPAVITFPGIALGIISSFFNPRLTPVDSLIGTGLGAFLLSAVYLAYKWIRKKEGLGHGDIALMAMVGAFLGWHQVVLVLFFSSLIGSLIGGLVILFFKKQPDFQLPFGTFIGAIVLPAIFWGEKLWFLYFNF